MKTDEQLLAQIALLEKSLGPRRGSPDGRCPIRVKINALRWRMKTRVAMPKEDKRSSSRAAALSRWETSPALLAKRQLAADKKLLAEVIRDLRAPLLAKRHEEALERAAEKNRVDALDHYRANREEINTARLLTGRQPLDHWYRKAVRSGEKQREANKADLFKAVASLEKRLGNRIHTRLLRVLRRRLNSAFKAGRAVSRTARELLGCEVPFLKTHLEALWKPGMSWDNYGYRGWHIDHTVPCAKFNLQDPEERRKCFHFSNLQPLWARENFAKRDN